MGIGSAIILGFSFILGCSIHGILNVLDSVFRIHEEKKMKEDQEMRKKLVQEQDSANKTCVKGFYSN